MNALILDVETTGLDPAKDRLIEVGAVLWNVEHRAIVEVYSGLMRADGSELDQKQADAFIDDIPSGANLRENDPVMTLRKGFV
jgi:DNA polymerase III epsilon subunit-like protein